MNSFLPFLIKPTPIQKLALIPFEKSRDRLYRGLELQYIDGIPYGSGYRVIAYRNDNYVDVYDDEALLFVKDETFQVAENGLHKHVQTKIEHVIFSKENNKQTISFCFTDMENRKIQIYIQEKSNKKTCPMNLLAPIGVGSKKPNYLPVFFMYDFDFVRRNKTEISCNIAGRKIAIDKFPFPMNGQLRWYARYSNECELFEFLNADSHKLKEISLTPENTYWDENVEYVFEKKNVLKSILVHFGKHHVQICFHPSLDFMKDCHGNFSIHPRPQMGYLQGEYQVQAGTRTAIAICPKDGWIPKPNSFITKMILGKKSVFQNWSKQYKYESVIDWNAKEIKSCWKNENIK